MRRNCEGYIAAPAHFHAFEQAVGRIANCKWAGKDWPLYRDNETVDQTVKRVMPNADWVIDKERKGTLKANRRYKVGCYLSDLQGLWGLKLMDSPAVINNINTMGYDTVFLKYKYIQGTRFPPDIYLKRLKPRVCFLPWSVNPDMYKPLPKRWDVTFIGFVGTPEIYPLREELWKKLPRFCSKRGLKLLRKTRVDAQGRRLRSDFVKVKKVDADPNLYFGNKYAKALGQTRFFIFGRSRLGYAIRKYFEAMSAGCTVVANEPDSAKELGFIDGKTYVKISRKNWQEKLDYYSKHYGKAKTIAKNARELILKRHTHKVRGREFLKMLESHR